MRRIWLYTSGHSSVIHLLFLEQLHNKNKKSKARLVQQSRLMLTLALVPMYIM